MRNRRGAPVPETFSLWPAGAFGPRRGVARHFVYGHKLTEGMLNRVETALSCSTHADGRLILEVELRSHDGELLDRRQTR